MRRNDSILFAYLRALRHALIWICLRLHLHPPDAETGCPRKFEVRIASTVDPPVRAQAAQTLYQRTEIESLKVPWRVWTHDRDFAFASASS